MANWNIETERLPCAFQWNGLEILALVQAAPIPIEQRIRTAAKKK
jgi:hypothetical protein